MTTTPRQNTTPGLNSTAAATGRMARRGGKLLVAGALMMLVQAGGHGVVPVHAQVGSRATVAIKQVNPPGWRRDVYINWNVEVQQFVEAIGTPNTTVHLVEDL